MAEQQPIIRRLVITRCNLRAEGVKNGKAWRLYNIDATGEDELPIASELKSFSELTLGPGEFEVKPQHHEKYGTSYMLTPQKGARMQALEQRVGELEGQVRALEGQVAELIRASGQPRSLAAVPDPPARQAEDAAKWGDGAPF